MSNFSPSNGGLPLSVTNPGKQFWVNNSSVITKKGVAGAAKAPGTYNRPVLTINQALDLCTADRGDVIFVMPGYTETIATAGGGFNLDVAGVAVVGLGSGALKPTFTQNGVVGADINLSADDCSIYNLRFVCGLADHTKALDVTGADITIDSCEFMGSIATTSYITPIVSSNAAFGLTIKNCVFNKDSSIVGTAMSDAAGQAISFDGDNTTIIDNHILGLFAVTGILNVTTAAEACIIARNKIFNESVAAAGGISLKAGCTGWCYDNNIFVLETSAVAGLLINASLFCFENYAGNVVTESSVIVPDVVSA